MLSASYTLAEPAAPGGVGFRGCSSLLLENESRDFMYEDLEIQLQKKRRAPQEAFGVNLQKTPPAPMESPRSWIPKNSANLENEKTKVSGSAGIKPV